MNEYAKSRVKVTEEGGNIWEESKNIYTRPTGDGISVATSYTELRSLDSSLVLNYIFVEDFTYTYNSVEYTTKGGFFRKVTIGLEDGGLYITASDGQVYQRVFNGVHYFPEWWEVGGYSPEAETGNIVYDESDRINAAILAMKDSGVLELIPAKTYVITRSINLKPWITINGNGAIIKRSDAIVTTLSSNVAAGATSFNVVDSSLIHQGREVNILDVSATNGGSGYNESSQNISGGMTVSSSASNTINITNTTVGASMVAGDKVVVVFTMITTTTNENFGGVQINNLRIDGNKSSNTHIYDWRYNAGITLTSKGDADLTRLNDCHFYEMPVEAYVGSGAAEDCSWEECNGSGFHIQNSAGIEGNPLGVDTFNIHNTLTNCTFKNMMLKGNDITEHSEGIIQTSTGYSNLVVTGGHIDNTNGGKGFAFGDSQGGNWNISKVNIVGVRDVIGTLGTGPGSSNDVKSGFFFTNNHLENCGLLSLESVNVGTILDQGNNAVIISGNTFTNCSGIILEGVSSAKVDNNVFKYNSSTKVGPFYDPLLLDATTGKNCVIYASLVDQLDITNNRIIGEYDNVQDEVKYGIYIDNQGWYNDGTEFGTGVSSNRNYWASSINIDNNKIYFLRVGIAVGDVNVSAGVAKSFSGVTIDNNIVVMAKTKHATESTIGILGWAGTTISNNKIFPLDTDANYYPIVAKGAQNFPMVDEQLGCYVTDNNVEGIPNDSHSIYLTGFNNYVGNNKLFTPITGSTTGTANKIENNNILDSSSFQFFGTPVRRSFHKVY